MGYGINLKKIQNSKLKNEWESIKSVNNNKERKPLIPTQYWLKM